MRERVMRVEGCEPAPEPEPEPERDPDAVRDTFPEREELPVDPLCAPRSMGWATGSPSKASTGARAAWRLRCADMAS